MAAVPDVRQAEARHAHQPGDVRRDHGRLIRFGRFGDRIAAERQAGVVEEDVEPAERVHRGLDEALAAFRVGHVELERHVRVDAFDTACSARDANSQRAQVPHDGRADPARRAGDDRGLAFEAHLANLISPGACST